MRERIRWLLPLLCVCAIVCRVHSAWAAPPASVAEAEARGRVIVKYWDKWSGFEMEAMQRVVDDFNAEQDQIYVDFLSISGISQKTLIATAGGNPPDIAGVWANDVIYFATKNAVTPLDEMAKGTVVRRERYLENYWDMGVYEGKLYGIPSTPGVTGLHWNKAHFRAAGLDPERPPRTMKELDEYAEKLTRVEDGNITQIGFLPSEPPWWPFFWVHFFGGELWDGADRVLLDSPENIRAFEWVQGYAKRYGVAALQTLSDSFGNFASAQNPFFSQRLSMVFQGVWLASYIEQYSPDLEWGAAPMPVLKEGDPPVAFVDTDMIVIPKGARHTLEAFEFFKFLSTQRETEKLNLGQRKNSPLKDVSDHFYATHKHPYIRMFQELAQSPGARNMPKMSIWREYRKETEHVFQRVWLMQATPKQALGEAQARIQKSWDRARRRQGLPRSEIWLWAPILLIALGVIALSIWIRRSASGRRVTGKSALANVSLGRGLSFFSPWGIGLLVFIAYPVVSSIVFSFCDYSVLQVPRFIGISNYLELFQDEVFWVALKNTVVFVLLALPLGLLISFFVALLLDANVRGSGIYRTLVFLPALTPVVASAMVWLWIYNAEYGALNDLLGKVSFGLLGPVPWLNDPRTALPSIVLMTFWALGHTIVILLASMQDVPTAMYEAAEIDGANLWHKVWHITLPLISPVLYFNAIMGIIGGLQIFTQPFIMTGGGPARATLTYTMHLYDSAFTYLRMGYASAMAWILFLVILALTVVAVRAGQRRVHYTGA